MKNKLQRIGIGLYCYDSALTHVAVLIYKLLFPWFGDVVLL
jgi:hypothetical protein